MTTHRPFLHNASRRLFLRQAGALSVLAGPAAPLALNLAALGSAAAQAAPDYKALVCLFMFGGNDAFNMVLPTDNASWAAYVATRTQSPDSIALLKPGEPRGGNGSSPTALGGVLPLNLVTPANHAGRSFALHPSMGAAQALFNTDRRLAVLPAVGPLALPTTKAQADDNRHPKPANLYSHNDQQNTWQALGPEGVSVGWGGRMADLLASANNKAVFTSISTSGNAVWLAGNAVRQFQVSSSGAVRMGTDNAGRVFGNTDVAAAMQRIVSATRGTHVLEGDVAEVARRSVDAETALRNALKPASDALFGTAPASGNYSANNDPKLRYTQPGGNTAFNSLAQQLQMVARMVDASNNAGIGARRQVFFVNIGGFDTHDNQNAQHADLMARVSHALKYFDDALGAMAARDKVTLFTASDFGRTFTSNGDGTDHGWGAHHFVLGGAVRGGDLYGSMPQLGVKNADNNRFDSSPHLLQNGVMLPATSVEQYAATLGRWFGVSDSQLLELLPALAQWNGAQRNLGFMR